MDKSWGGITPSPMVIMLNFNLTCGINIWRQIIMKETIKAIFNYGRVYILLYLCGIGLINILPITSFGIETAYAGPIFSVKSDNEPLYKVLAKISRTTGYKIAIPNNLENKSITINLKNSTIEESIERIINLIGDPNYALVIDDSVKKIEIIIFDASSDNSSISTNNPAEHRQIQKEHTGRDTDAGVKHDFNINEMTPPGPDTMSSGNRFHP
jgi:hypothetical protein